MAVRFKLICLLIVPCFDIVLASNSTSAGNCKFFNKNFLWCKNGIPNFSSYNQTRLNDVTALWIDICDHVYIENDISSTFKQLKNLKIACEKTEIAKYAFDNPGNISLLEIERNAVSFPENAFCNFSNLQHLWLKSNQLSADYDVGLVTNCSTLSQNGQCGETITWLSLAHNNLTYIKNDGFLCNLRSLTRLDLANNAISSIDKRAFISVPELSTLKLAGNLIANLSDDTFSFLVNLLDLDLSYNQLLFVPENLFNSLPNLSYLKLAGNNLTEIKNQTFENVSDLIRLDISDNRLSNVSGIFTSLTGINLLNVSRNQLEQIDSSTFSNLFTLEKLYLDWNVISEISEDAFNGCTKMTKLDLSYNQLEQVPNLNFSPQIASLHLQHNKIKNFLTSGLNILAESELNSSKALINSLLLDLSYNEIQFVNDSIIQALSRKVPFNSIEKLDLSHNQITDFEYPSKVIHLNLAHNKIEQLPFFRFENSSQMESLNLSHNFIENLSADQLPTSLTHLVLDSNFLTYFNASTFTNLVKLRLLNAQNNSLVTLPNLDLPMSIRFIDIGDNPWSCDCHFVQSVFNFIQMHRKQILKANQLSCQLNDAKKSAVQIVNINITQCADG